MYTVFSPQPIENDKKISRELFEVHDLLYIFLSNGAWTIWGAITNRIIRVFEVGWLLVVGDVLPEMGYTWNNTAAEAIQSKVEVLPVQFWP